MYPAMRLVARVSCLTWGEPPDGVSRTGSDGGSAKPGAGHASRGRCHSSPLLCSTRSRLPFKVLTNRRRGWRVMRRPTLNCA